MEEAEQDQWFAEEVQPYEPQLRSYLINKFPTLEDMDDVIQESYARLLKTRLTRHVDQPKALLFTIARNIVYDQFRRKKVVQFNSLAQFPDSSVLEDKASVAEIVSLRDEIYLLAQAVETLPKRCRQVMTLRMVYGYRNKEIAKDLGISPHTVKAQLAKGMRRTAEFLARYAD